MATKTKNNNKPARPATTPNTISIDPTPYYFTPSYITHAGKTQTILQLYIRTGSNRDLSYEEILDLIPSSPLDGIDLTFITQHTTITGDTKKRLIRKNAISSKQSLEAINDSKETPKEDFTQDNLETRQNEYNDYNEYETIIGSNEPIVCYKISLIITADTRELIEEQIDLINRGLAQTHDGAQWDNIAGDQQTELYGLFRKYEPSKYHHTSTGDSYSRMQYDVTPGLLDRNGVLVGTDPMSLTGSPCMLDFDTSIRQTGIISLPSSSTLPWYKTVSRKPNSVPSMLAQAAANQIVSSELYRVHHICLNGYSYLKDDHGYTRNTESLQNHIHVHDMRTQTVNPMQGYGRIENVVDVYTRLVNKIVDLFNIMQNYEMTEEQRSVVHEAVNSFYFNQDLWINDAERHKHRTRIVNIEDPSTYPTMGSFINDFKTLSKAAVVNGRELRADLVDSLSSTLQFALSTHFSIVGNTTNIQDQQKPQTYYDYSRITDLSTKQLQFINTLEWIINCCGDDDLIVVHGADLLFEKTFTMAYPALLAMRQRNIRLLLCFDKIESHTVTGLKQLDMFQCKGSLYNDLSTDIDLLVTGQFTPGELSLFEGVFNTELSSTMRASLLNKTSNLSMVYRSSNNANHFVYLNTVI